MKQPQNRLATETELHHGLVDWIRKVGEIVYPALAYLKHTPNEALSSGRDTRAVRQANGTIRQVPISVLRGGRMGVRPGVWDFEFLAQNQGAIPAPPYLPPAYSRYNGLAIELKSSGGAVSADQKRWALHYSQNHWYTAVVVGDWAPAARLLVRWVGGDPARMEGLA